MTEEEVFGKYLMGGKEPNEKCKQLYKEAIVKLSIELNSREQKIIEHMIKNPGSIKWIDSGLAWRENNSPIRKRILVMSAILEAQPEHSSHLFSKKPTTFFVFWAGIRALFKAAVGAVFIKFF